MPYYCSPLSLRGLGASFQGSITTRGGIAEDRQERTVTPWFQMASRDQQVLNGAGEERGPDRKARNRDPVARRFGRLDGSDIQAMKNGFSVNGIITEAVEFSSK
jgi:hypothetical protein